MPAPELRTTWSYADMMPESIDYKQHAHVVSHDVESINSHNAEPPKKLILCFDGTTNEFMGSDADTNVVKLFEMFDRLDKHQHHYYQPGIGTYVANTNIRNVQTNDFRSKFKASQDTMYASSFADHVIAGYKFLMRYYMETSGGFGGDTVYVFGFSRGAYTARFLCEMLNDIGLLSMGNEENLPFLWYHYSNFRRSPTDAAREEMVKNMSRVFCRKQKHHFVYFLGLWDCVNSVAKFRNASEIAQYANASPNIAMHVRHAVSCHERRVMFRPTLFIADKNRSGTVEERWFAGNHGDCGGGWAPADDKTLLLSDLPLIWMVEELQKQERLDNASGATQLQISWRTADPRAEDYKMKNKNTFDERKEHLNKCVERLQRGTMRNLDTVLHDVMSPSRGGGRFWVMFWWMLEYLPLAHTNLCLQRDKDWKRQQDGKLTKESHYVAVPTRSAAKGAPRRIPLDPHAVIDPSLELLYRAGIVPSMSKYANNQGKVVHEGGQHRFFPHRR